MKANEAPEKIYVVDATFPDYVDFDGSPINTKRIDDNDIEYTRTDVFIDKACELLEPVFKDLAGYYSGVELLDNFKNYMKGE